MDLISKCSGLALLYILGNFSQKFYDLQVRSVVSRGQLERRKIVDRTETTLTRSALPALGWRMAMISSVGAMVMVSKIDNLIWRHVRWDPRIISYTWMALTRLLTNHWIPAASAQVDQSLNSYSSNHKPIASEFQEHKRFLISKQEIA